MGIENRTEFSPHVLPEEIVSNFKNIDGEPLAPDILDVVLSGDYWGIFTVATPGSGKTETNRYISKFCTDNGILHIIVSYEHYLKNSIIMFNEELEKDPNKKKTVIKGEEDMTPSQSKRFIKTMKEGILNIHKANPDVLVICEMPAGMHRHEPEVAVERVISKSRKSKDGGVCILQIEASDGVHRLSDIERIKAHYRNRLAPMTNSHIYDVQRIERLNNSATASQSAKARKNHNGHAEIILKEATTSPHSKLIQYQQESIPIPFGMNVEPEDWQRISRNLVAMAEYWKRRLGRNDKLILAVNTAIRV